MAAIPKPILQAGIRLTVTEGELWIINTQTERATAKPATPSQQFACIILTLRGFAREEFIPLDIEQPSSAHSKPPLRTKKSSLAGEK
jgi:hypothetical protein